MVAAPWKRLTPDSRTRTTRLQEDGHLRTGGTGGGGFSSVRHGAAPGAGTESSRGSGRAAVLVGEQRPDDDAVRLVPAGRPPEAARRGVRGRGEQLRNGIALDHG